MGSLGRHRHRWMDPCVRPLGATSARGIPTDNPPRLNDRFIIGMVIPFFSDMLSLSTSFCHLNVSSRYVFPSLSPVQRLLEMRLTGLLCSLLALRLVVRLHLLGVRLSKPLQGPTV